MKKIRFAILGAMSAFLFACSDSDSSGTSTEGGEVAITDKTISGVSQKGPFVKGSSVTVYELGAQSLSQTGKSYDGKIKNERGEFTVEVEKLGSPYALLKADGYYRNEITGEKSNGTVTLYAMTDLSNRNEVNVNLLTHLEYERSRYLVKNEKMSVAEAKKQAEKEVLESFGIKGDFENSENLNIFGDDAGSAALLAISVLMQGDLKEADFTERLNDYASDIEDDGKWDDKKTATSIADWAITQSMSGGLALIRNNIAGWKLSTGVPAFEKYVDNFWWRNYGLGTCEKNREGEVMKNQNAGSAFADKYFICKSNLWYVATDMEKDTYEWKEGKDGDAKYGDVIKSNCYVFEDSSWRSGYESDCSLELRGCTKNRQDTVGLGKDNVWYICDARSWREATDIEKDTATWGAGKNDGEIRKGQINKGAFYIYDASGEMWRNATSIEIDTYDYEKKERTKCLKFGQIIHGSVNDGYAYFCYENEWKRFYGNDSVSYGKLIDERDGLIYRTVQIGNQTWMAENLNYSDVQKKQILKEQSWCYNNSAVNCEKYGRLYTWAAAMDSATTGCGTSQKCLQTTSVQGICPKGWHVPNNQDWDELLLFVDSIGVDLQANCKWINQSTGDFINGNDKYGFSAYPGGYKERKGDDRFYGIGSDVGFWSATDSGPIDAFNVWFNDIQQKIKIGEYVKYEGLSVRCIKDEDE